MAILDLRKSENEVITHIQFGDTGDSDRYLTVCQLHNSDTGVVLLDEDGDELSGVIGSKDHARRMVNAIEKAIQLGWFDN